MDPEQIKLLGETAVGFPELLQTALDEASSLDARLVEQRERIESMAAATFTRIEDVFAALAEFRVESDVIAETLSGELSEVEDLLTALSTGVTDEQASLSAGVTEVQDRLGALATTTEATVQTIGNATHAVYAAVQMLEGQQQAGAESLASDFATTMNEFRDLQGSAAAAQQTAQSEVGSMVGTIDDAQIALLSRLGALSDELHSVTADFDHKVETVLATQLVEPVDELTRQTNEQIAKRLKATVDRTAGQLEDIIRGAINEVRAEGHKSSKLSGRMEPLVQELNQLIPQLERAIEHVDRVKQELAEID